jgi:hypothetical protein
MCHWLRYGVYQSVIARSLPFEVEIYVHASYCSTHVRRPLDTSARGSRAVLALFDSSLLSLALLSLAAITASTTV